MSNVASWRRRCLAAEERADKAERALKRLRARYTRAGAELSMLSEAIYAKTLEVSDLNKTLNSIARYHLGPESTLKERADLCKLWEAEAQKRRGIEDKDIIKQITAEMNDTLKNLIRDDEDE